MNTMTALALTGRPLEDRRAHILEILNNGMAVRFHYRRPGGASFYKDVIDFDPDEDGDIKAFRQSGGATDWVCWQAMELGLEEVEP